VSLSPSLHLEELVAADVPVWITVDCWASDEKEEAFGIKHATRVIRRTTLIPFAQKPLALPRAASGCC
jgi:3-methyladenine DNA glycosylase AlkC